MQASVKDYKDELYVMFLLKGDWVSHVLRTPRGWEPTQMQIVDAALVSDPNVLNAPMVGHVAYTH
jgi:hypothetical protein